VRSSLLCTLPPTCNLPNHATPLSSTHALEAHYATYHAHVCSSPGCGCVFPDAHFLELHLTECHDPLAALRRERGDKIFACHLSSCPRVFTNPKTRRQHLISVHAYPKEYFFAITNKGIGGLLRRWGEGASLLRGQWHPRDNNDEDEDEGAEDDGASLPPSSAQHSDDSDGSDDDHLEGEGVEAASAVPTVNGDGQAETEKMSEDNGDDDAVDALTQGVSDLGLVPSSVRFGRGGSARGRAGLATRGGRPVARHLGQASHPAHPRQQSQAPTTTAVGETSEEKVNANANDAEDSDVMEQDVVVAPEKPISARGRRGRGRAGGGGGGGAGRGMGRGRGGFVPPPPRAGFLARGGAGHSRGLPRGMIANVIRARGRGALV